VWWRDHLVRGNHRAGSRNIFNFVTRDLFWSGSPIDHRHAAPDGRLRAVEQPRDRGHGPVDLVEEPVDRTGYGICHPGRLGDLPRGVAFL
jgi:hypothetical protein